MAIEIDAKKAKNRWAEVIDIVQRRRMSDHGVKTAMQEIANRYNGDVVIPLNHVQGEPEFPLVASPILPDAIDGFATRATDVLPQIYSLADTDSAAARRRAEARADATGAIYTHSKLSYTLGRTARQYRGYGAFCLYARPDARGEGAKIVPRNPLFAYPDDMEIEDVRRPENIGFVYGRSIAWLRAEYPDNTQLKQILSHARDIDEVWDVLEWWDNDHHFLGIIGRRDPAMYRNATGGSVSLQVGQRIDFDQQILLDAFPNRVGHVPVIMPAAMTLDRMQSRLKRILPITDLMNKLTALDFISKQKEAFPAMYVTGAQGRQPTIVGGRWNRGESGQINRLVDVEEVGVLQPNNSQGSQFLAATLERAARMGAAEPSMLQGEFTGAIRSGQVANTMAGFAADPEMKEFHRVLEYALTEINESAAEIQKLVHGGNRITVFNGWNGKREQISYVPNEVWKDSIKTTVHYPLPGMDAFNITTMLGVMKDDGMMSEHSAREAHPNITDADFERRQIIAEELNRALIAQVQGQAAEGLIPTEVIVDLHNFVLYEKMEFADAWKRAQELFQERQAEQAQSPPQEVEPAAQPGIDPAGQPPAAPPGQSQQPSLDQLFAALGGGGAGAGPGAVPPQ